MSEQDTTVSEETTSQETPVEETADELKARLVEVEAQNKQLYARLQKEKEQKSTPAEEPKPATNSTVSRDEAILFAKGYELEEVELAQKLAQINGTTLFEAAKDPYVQAKVEERKKAEQAEKASLGASSGVTAKPAKPVGDMTREEHIALFNKVMGNV